MNKFGVEGGCGHTDKQIMYSAAVVTFCIIACFLLLIAAIIAA